MSSLPTATSYLCFWWRSWVSSILFEKRNFFIWSYWSEQGFCVEHSDACYKHLPGSSTSPSADGRKLTAALPPGSLQSKGEIWYMLDSSMYPAKKENTEKRIRRVGIEILEKMLSASLTKWLFNKESENVNIMERQS